MAAAKAAVEYGTGLCHINHAFRFRLNRPAFMNLAIPSPDFDEVDPVDAFQRDQSSYGMEGVNIRESNVLDASGCRRVGHGCCGFCQLAQVCEVYGLGTVKIHEGDHGYHGEKEERKRQRAFNGQAGFFQDDIRECFSEKDLPALRGGGGRSAQI